MKFKTLAVVLTLPGVFGLCTNASAEGELNVINWAEYIGEDTISNFEKEYGIRVTYDNYDSIEAIDSKLLAGNSGYDVVVHDARAIARLIPAGMLQPIDKSRLDNFEHLSAEILQQVSSSWDPDNQYIVPYMWGTHGVTYNEELVRSMHPNAPIGSMELIFDPKHMEKIAQCGVAFLDSPTDIIPMALAHLGFNPASENQSEINQAKEMLLKIRPYIKTFDNYAYQRMPEKEFCVAVTFGPDSLLAIASAQEAGTDVKLDFYLPPGQGKANLWVDGWVIPADAKHIDNAYLFLNYMLRPEVAAADSNYTWYATANKDAVEFIDEAVTSSPAAYPTDEQVAQMYPLAVVSKKAERARTRAWTSFKAGG